MNFDSLNKAYGIPDTLKFAVGSGSRPFVTITNKSAKALISLHGGQVLSYLPTHEPEDLLFLSNKAVYEDKKAIRGGIPVCWPWFGRDPENLNRPSHGFARNSLWDVAETQATSDDETRLTLKLLPATEYKALWPNSFDLTLIITVSDSLTLELVTDNTGSKAFTITQALHSYFNIGHIEQVNVLGLADNFYFDKLDHSAYQQQIGDISVVEELDRIYTNVKSQLFIKDPIFNRSLQITSKGNKTAVVWNPWKKNSAQITDLENSDYQRFLCLEACNAATDSIEIAPGNKHSLLTNFKVLREI